VARELGYLRVPKGVVISNSKAKKLPQGKITVLAAGSQGQERSALARMVRGDHRFFKIGQGDLVLFASDLIPGNEARVRALIRDSKKSGAKVLYLEEMPDIHVSGHAYAEDLKGIILLAKAQYLLPIGGTPGSTQAYVKLAKGLNYRHDQILLPGNGEIIEFCHRPDRRDHPLVRSAGKVPLREITVSQD
jgi:ribonuclease J